MRRPRPLVPGDLVRVVAPSSPFDHGRLPAGLDLLKGLGLETRCPHAIYRADGYLAGPDEDRAADLLDAFLDPDAAAVIPARGGYGAMRLLPRIAEAEPGLPPRFFQGFSDITALHLLFLGRLGTFHGPNVISATTADDETLLRLRRTLFGDDPESTFHYDGLRPLHGGIARGRIVAGNLALLAALVGTPWAAPLDGAILVIEDVNEPAYRIDRTLTTLFLQADAHRIAGIAFGDLGVNEAEREVLDRALHRFAAAWRRPMVAGFPIGHGPRNFPVPQAVMATLDADHGILRIDESPYGS